VNISCASGNSRSLIFLAPAGTRLRRTSFKAQRDGSRHESLKAEMQRLRGRVYLQDGAITPAELSGDRHILPVDDACWHLLVCENGEVLGCTRFLQHRSGTRFDDLRISESALASSDLWGGRLRAAVEQDLRDAADTGFSYVEVGGWAIAEKIRCTAECLRSVLAVYAWSRLVGGAIGVSTATERNGSASILRRLGGNSLRWNNSEIPDYYDPRYDCRMHMLRYDSRSPAPRYEVLIKGIERALASIPVVFPDRPACQKLFRGFSGAPEGAPSIGSVAPIAA
jgi:hypothetical protein